VGMKHSQPTDEVIAIRPRLRLPIVLFCIATVILFLGSLKFMPFIHDRNPTVGFAIFGVAAGVGIMGYLQIRDRRQRVRFTEDELQLPGWGIERIPWRDVVRAEAYVYHDGAYLGIDLRPAARGHVRPPIHNRVGELFGAVSGRRHDLWLIHCEALEWSPDDLADEINRRASEAAAAAAR
jgi:hypothetical protein